MRLVIQCHDGNGRKPDNPTGRLKLLALPYAERNEAREVFAMVPEQRIGWIMAGDVEPLDRRRFVLDLVEEKPGSTRILKPIASYGGRILMPDYRVRSVYALYSEPVAKVGDTVMVGSLFSRQLHREIETVCMALGTAWHSLLHKPDPSVGAKRSRFKEARGQAIHLNTLTV